MLLTVAMVLMVALPAFGRPAAEEREVPRKHLAGSQAQRARDI
ncbi:MAG: hypothetical protein QOI73_1982 [Solirubrobacteraceae bacterium]|nr:hypothetical protein [Solirubrobacteraceae bacterium]